MFRRGRRCLAITLAVAALALSAAPAAAARRSEDGAAWTVGAELWARLGQIGDWIRRLLPMDGTPYVDPNGSSNS